MDRQIDWDRLWIEDGKKSSHSDDVGFWDEFAPRFRKKLPEGQTDSYVEQFYDLSAFEGMETIFDMGCGSGTLAIPFALRGHEIWAADFSGNMLEQLMIEAEKEGVAGRIHPIRLDWNEDWSEREDLPVCDVAISSRSFMARSLTDGISKLESRAKDRVCVGAWDTPASGYVRELAKAIGYERAGYGCYAFIMGELMERDMRPQLRWISNPFRRSTYDTREDALDKLKASFVYGLDDDQEKAVEQYCDEHLHYHEDGERTYWKMDLDETSTIAHIMWSV